MSEEQDDSQKTEEPTQHRLEEARKKGQLPFSREVVNFAVLLSITIILAAMGEFLSVSTMQAIQMFIISPHDIAIGDSNFPDIFSASFGNAGLYLLIPLMLFFVVILAAGFSQTKMNFSAHPIKFDPSRISVIKGFGRLFSGKAIAEFLKSLTKIIVVGVICYFAIRPFLPILLEITEHEAGDDIYVSLKICLKILIYVCVAMAFIAIADYLYQRQVFMKSMRMSFQELKEEFKQQEGDPHVKQKLRAIRMEKARKRMMANVPKADVVITNPTHFAVALKYETGKMSAPTLIAKGADKVAHKIREIAEEHKIPIVRNPPLARALFDNVDLDEEIPTEHYKAVAEVIGYVYRLKGKKK